MEIFVGQLRQSGQLPATGAVFLLYPGALMYKARDFARYGSPLALPSSAEVLAQFNMSQPVILYSPQEESEDKEEDDKEEDKEEDGAEITGDGQAKNSLETWVGCYFIVAGAIAAQAKSARMAFLGFMIVLIGFVKDEFLKPRRGGEETVLVSHQLYTSFYFMLLCSFLSLHMDKSRLKKLVVPSKSKSSRMVGKRKLA